MAKYFDEEGNEIEAFSKEEFEAKKKEAIEEYTKNNPDKSAELTKLQEDLKLAQEALKKAEDKGMPDGQKQRLKDAKEAAENAMKEMSEKFSREISSLKETITGSTKKSMLEKLSGGDAELKKKIEFEYEQFKGEPVTQEDIQQRLQKAFVVATGKPLTPGFLDGITNAGSKGEQQRSDGGAQQETENAKALRKVMGITDEEVKKFGPKITN